VVMAGVCAVGDLSATASAPRLSYVVALAQGQSNVHNHFLESEFQTKASLDAYKVAVSAEKLKQTGELKVTIPVATLSGGLSTSLPPYAGYGTHEAARDS